jgi:hypothetical protein
MRANPGTVIFEHFIEKAGHRHATLLIEMFLSFISQSRNMPGQKSGASRAS